jgi:hypothetical protein
MIQTNQEYDTDFYGWSEHQAELLKNKEFDKLDILNLIEEIETLGRSEKRTLKSYLIILLIHLLKVKYQPEKHTRSWDLSIKNSRREFMECLSENPSLKPKLLDILESAYFSARISAIQQTGLEEEIFPIECPWTIEELKICEV